MIATVILAVGASAAMVATAASYQQQRYAAEQSTASDLAVMLLEEVSARPYERGGTPTSSSAQAMDGYGDTMKPDRSNAALGYTGPAYARALTVKSGTASGLPAGVGVASVEVTSPSGRKVSMRRLLFAAD